MSFIKIAAASSGNNTLIAAPGAGKAIRVQGLVCIGTAAVNAYIRSGTAGTEHVGGAAAPIPFAASTGFALQPVTSAYFQCDENAALVLNLDGAIPVAGCVVYDIVKTT